MDIQIIKEASSRSLQGTMSFGEVVRDLNKIGVESYQADLVRMQTTYYMPDGKTHVENMDYKGPAAAQDFVHEAVIRAIKSIQKGEIKYVQFLDQILNAGITHYAVYLQGKKAIYFGRKGDFHIEHFPK